jgi:hypothetical protein
VEQAPSGPRCRKSQRLLFFGWRTAGVVWTLRSVEMADPLKIPVMARLYQLGDDPDSPEDEPEKIPLLVSSDGEHLWVESPDAERTYMSIDLEPLLAAIKRSETSF